MTHTQGKWLIDQGNEKWGMNIHTITDKGAHEVITFMEPSWFVPDDRKQANARLIAAAPEMLAMLKQTYKYMVNYRKCQNQTFLNDIAALINQIEGK